MHTCVYDAVMLSAWFVSLDKMQVLVCPTLHIGNKDKSNDIRMARYVFILHSVSL